MSSSRKIEEFCYIHFRLFWENPYRAQGLLWWVDKISDSGNSQRNAIIILCDSQISDGLQNWMKEAGY